MSRVFARITRSVQVRGRVVLAGVAALTLTAAGCTTGSGDPGADGTAAAPGTTAAQPAANLSRFYEQTPKWGACDDVQPETQGSQCTWLEVHCEPCVSGCTSSQAPHFGVCS